jgi:hypothetical protein
MESTYTIHAKKGREYDTFHRLTAAQVVRKEKKLVAAGYTCTIVPDEPPTQQGTRNGSLR